MENYKLNNPVNILEYMVSTAPYIDNTNNSISGLVGSSLGGTILNKPYRRPDPQNLNGVFDYYGMQNQQKIANEVAMNDLKNNILMENDNPINPENSPVAKLLNQNNIKDTKISLYGLFPEVLFPPTNQPLPSKN